MSALVTPVVPMANANFVELITRAVAAAMVTVDAQLKALRTETIAMQNVEETDGLGDI